MAGNETVVLVRPPARGPFGDPLPGSATETTVDGCLYAPGSSVEGGLGANTVDTTGTVYAPPGTSVLATDQVRVRGVLYNVVGEPQDWGSSAGVVINLRRATG